MKFMKQMVRRGMCMLLFLIPFLASPLLAQQGIQVLSAVVKDKTIAGAQVLLQKNGEQTMTGYTDANGFVKLDPAFVDDASAMVIIKKEGYSTLVAKCPCQGLTYAISPTIESLDGMRIVLSWGAEPADLDSHLWYGNNHIFWDKKKGDKALLDVDDRDSYGPETITIDSRIFGTDYYYAVYDYTNKESASPNYLAQSAAKVFVYIGNSLVKSYYMPKSRTGNLWTVFKVTKEGEIEDINSVTTTNAKPTSTLRYNVSDATGVVSSRDVNKEEALRLNKLGTLEYNKKNYQTAINHYLAAIEYYPQFGQAYGNLGLCYKKQGQDAEALWATRQAIAYAEGNTAKVTRAGAYYNLGRIYEEKGEYANAKEQYESAKGEVDKPTYDEAIKRMDSMIEEEN